MEFIMIVLNLVELIKEVVEKYNGIDVIVGVGIVLDIEIVRVCILVGV